MEEEPPETTEEENDFPPLMAITHVRTTADNLHNLNNVPVEIYQYERKWRTTGMVMEPLEENDDYYEVWHFTDHTLGLYHTTELEILDDDDDGDEDWLPIESEDPSSLIPSDKPVLELVTC